jgi:hypothetical protein
MPYGLLVGLRLRCPREVRLEPTRQLGERLHQPRALCSPRANRVRIAIEIRSRDTLRVEKGNQLPHASDGHEPRLERAPLSPMPHVKPARERRARVRPLVVDGAYVRIVHARGGDVAHQRGARLLEGAPVTQHAQTVPPRQGDFFRSKWDAPKQRPIAAETACAAQRGQLVRRCVVRHATRVAA